MFRRATLLIALLLFFISPLAVLASPPLEAGVYVREGGTGELTIQIATAEGQALQLNAIGTNAHLCGFSGFIKAGVLTLEENAEEGACIVLFKPQQKGIEVIGLNSLNNSEESGHCRYYCGARAYFGGLYLKPSPGCSYKERKESARQFLAFYKQKQYARALAELEPILKNCSEVINPIYDEGKIRNDLAVTYHKLGRYEECRKILARYEEDAAFTNEEIKKNSTAPTETESYLQTLSAARFNLKLCAEAEKKSMSSKKIK